jgi:hypothetical protein
MLPRALRIACGLSAAIAALAETSGVAAQPADAPEAARPDSRPSTDAPEAARPDSRPSTDAPEAARADSRPSTERPRFAFLEAPPPAPPPTPPAPARESDEFPRRAWELFPQLGLSAPFCRGDSFGVNHCAGIGNGTSFGGGALFRITPYVALGAEASFSGFDFAVDGAASTFSRASWLGLVVRGYFLDRGTVEPYVEAGIGRGTSSSGYGAGAGLVSVEASGPASLVGAGVDFWVSPFLRMGPALTYRWTFLSDVRECTGSVCQAARVADEGAIGSFASVSFVATVALGREM